MGLNNISIKGNIGKDIELKEVNGKSLISFSIAVSRFDKTTAWFNIEAWGKTAENIHTFFHKGDSIIINGRLDYNEVEKDGIKKQYYKIIANEFDFCNGKKSETDNNAHTNDAPPKPVADKPNSYSKTQDENLLDIPF